MTATSLAIMLTFIFATSDMDAAITRDELLQYDTPALVELILLLQARVLQLEDELQALSQESNSSLAVEHLPDDADLPAEVNSEGMWSVTVTLNPEPDVTPLQERIRELEYRLYGPQRLAEEELRYDPYGRRHNRTFKSNNQRLDEANKALTGLLQRERDREGRERNTSGQRQIAAAQADVRRVENEKRQVEVEIRRIRQQIDHVSSTRNVIAVDGEGRVITIVGRGPAFHVATSMVEGVRYSVVGRGTFTETRGRILLQSAAIEDL
jgi:uncharacterized protein YlxW (UPF0749 family)